MGAAVMTKTPLHRKRIANVRVPPHLWHWLRNEADEQEVPYTRLLIGLALEGLEARGIPEAQLLAEWYEHQAEAARDSIAG